MNAVRMVSAGFADWETALDHAIWMHGLTGIKYSVKKRRHNQERRWHIYTAGTVKDKR